VKHKDSQQYKESAWELTKLIFTPRVKDIACEPSIPECGKAVTLSCLVEDYNPPQCDVCWRKGFQELIGAEITTQEPQLNTVTNLYYRKSQIIFTPTPEDHAAELTIEANHCNKIIRNTYTLMLKGNYSN
uniref:Ig-like domain-containing protein n=1 Tax=Sphenodon punctatus TaxID=8508 RepID=A0A8D0GUC2_SPHPU